MKQIEPKLKDGSEWVDHEDCIVGDEAGIRNLISACEAALEKGEFYGKGLGDYVGVKKLKTEWFKEPMDSPKTRYGNYLLAGFLLLVGFLTLVGLGTVLSWAFQANT